MKNIIVSLSLVFFLFISIAIFTNCYSIETEDLMQVEKHRDFPIDKDGNPLYKHEPGKTYETRIPINTSTVVKPVILNPEVLKRYYPDCVSKIGLYPRLIYWRERYSPIYRVGGKKEIAKETTFGPGWKRLDFEEAVSPYDKWSIVGYYIGYDRVKCRVWVTKDKAMRVGVRKWEEEQPPIPAPPKKREAWWFTPYPR